MTSYRVEVQISGPVEGIRTGVGGMAVRLMARSDGGDMTLAELQTRADGIATFLFDAPREIIRDDGSVLVREIVSDRDGVLVHEARRARAVGAEEMLAITCKLETQDISSHLDRPLGFSRADKGVDRAAIEADIDRAIEGFAASGSSGFTNLRTAALCPGPAFDLFEELRLDALDVIDGDPRAIERFQDTLQIVRDRNESIVQVAPDSDQPRPVTELFDNPFTPDIDRISPAFQPGFKPSRDLRTLSDPARGSRPVTVVPREHGAIVMTAAAQIATSRSQIVQDIGLVFDTLCDFEEIGVLRRIGIEGLTDPRSRSKFGGILGARGGEWGPDDGPPIGLRPRVPCKPFVSEHADCAREIVQSLKTGVSRYTINSIDRVDACPGETIVISGSGFTDTVGTVEFIHRNGSTISVDPVEWSETRIVVVVPDDVTCTIRLRIFERTDRVCGRFIDVYRKPVINVDFMGGAANITLFKAGQTGNQPVCIQPGQPLTVRWATCAAASTLVQVLDQNDDVVASSSDPSGELIHNIATEGGRVRDWSVKIKVTGSCVPFESTESIDIRIEPRPDLTIDGVEVTQAIQHYRSNMHLNNSQGSDNSLAYVVGKSA